MAIRLTGEYQYIGRSNAVSCPSGYNYYILLYAKTVANMTTGEHTMTVKQRLACDSDSSFYGFGTTAEVKVAGIPTFSWNWEAVPNDYWGDSNRLIEDGITYLRWVDLREGSVVVNAGFGADKTVTVDSSWVMVDSYDRGWFPYTGKYAKASVDVILPMIAGSSAIVSASDAVVGSSANIVWTPMAASLHYKVKLSIGNWSWLSPAIHPNQTGAYTYTTADISYDAAAELPNAVSGTMTVTLYTHTDSACSNQIGSASTASFALTVPDNETTKPSVSMRLSPVHALPSAFNGLYIQGKSRVKAAISAEGKYGASIKSYSMKAEGATYDAGDEYTSGYLAQYGSLTVTGYAKDSRGFTGSETEQIAVLAYSKPKILDASAERCDANGNLSDSGTYLKIKAKRSYSQVKSGGVQKNFCQIRYRYKASSAANYSEWTTILARNNLTSDAVETGALLGGVLVPNSSYLVQIQAIDDIGDYAESIIAVSTDAVHTHKTKSGIGFGKYVEGENRMEVGWDAHFYGSVNIGGMPLRDYILAVISEGG